MGFGGLSGWAVVLVGLSWGFADRVLGDLDIAGTAGHVTMAVAYFILGMTGGKTRSDVLYAGAGPMLGSVLGIGLGAFVFPQQMAQGIEERSEEHTSELQSLMRISYAVFCLKKKTKQT